MAPNGLNIAPIYPGSKIDAQHPRWYRFQLNTPKPESRKTTLGLAAHRAVSPTRFTGFTAFLALGPETIRCRTFSLTLCEIAKWPISDFFPEKNRASYAQLNYKREWEDL